MNVLVTGGAGFIGSHLVDDLLAKGHKPIVYDNFATGKKQNLEHIKDKVTIIEGDICDFDKLKNAMKNADCVLHQAAAVSVPRSIKEPQLYVDVNIKGTLNVLEASRLSGVKRVVFASSSSVYGDSNKFPIKEENTGTRLSPYAISKYSAEDFCKYFWKVQGLATVALRYFNVFGPRQDPTSQYAAVIPKFIMMLLEGKQPTIYGDGEQVRDFTYVKNVTHGNILALEAKDAPGMSINLANKEGITVNQLFSKIAKLLETNIKPIYTNPRPGDIHSSLAENAKAKKLLKYSPVVSFDEGLKLTVDWFVQQWKKKSA
jgi:UDP-glucose 4-epimerase